MQFKLSESFLEQYKTMEPDWGPMGEFVYLRTYSRRIESENRNEKWWETVRRVVEGVFGIQKNHCVSLNLPWKQEKAQRSAQVMYDKIFTFKFLPSGRNLWMMGTPFVELRGGTSLLNCSFVSTEDIKDQGANLYASVMDLLMLGVGAGLDCKGAGKLIIKAPKPDGVYIIPDSREGWVESVRMLLDAFFSGKVLPTFDYSLIRPAGSPIRGFGGTASGPAPLKQLHESLTEMLTARIGKSLSSVDIVDIENYISVCVIAGNVRRSAAIMIGEADDSDYVTMKDYKLHPKELLSRRWSSNNSVFAKVGQTDYASLMESIALNGEPGIVWLENMQKYGRTIDPINWKDADVRGTNACFVKGTLVHTKQGHFPIEELVGKTVEVHDGDGWVTIDNFRITGENRAMLSVELQDGTVITTTDDHRFLLEDGSKVLARDLTEGARLMLSSADETHGTIRAKGAYLKGFLVGDGTNGKDGSILYLYEPKYMCMERLISSAYEIPVKPDNVHSIEHVDFVDQSSSKRGKAVNRKTMRGLSARSYELAPYGGIYKLEFPTEVFQWDRYSKLEFIAGVMDADGTAMDTTHGFGYQITSIYKDWLLGFQSLLKTIGVQSKVDFCRHGGFKDFGDGYGDYPTKDQYRMTIGQKSAIYLAEQVTFTRLVSFAGRSTIYNVKTKRNVVAAITDAGIADRVYCCTVPTNHTFSLTCGIRIGQCGEISLQSKEFCNLAELFPSRHDSFEEYKETIKMAYLYTKSVTLVPTHLPDFNAVMLKNRRIGLSQSGIIDAFAKHGRRTVLNWSNEGYKYIEKLDEKYSDWLCIPRSRKTTTVKPSGTISLLPGVSPGIHYPHAEYYIRRVRVSKHNPIVEVMRVAGYTIEDDVYDKGNTAVICFPIHEQFFAKKKEDVTIWEQCQNVADLQRYWADNNVSVTVTFKKEERGDIVSVLEAYEDSLKTISFLPLTDHGYEQAPYEEITEERYKEMIVGLAKPDFSFITSTPIGSKFCDGESCTIG